MAVDDRARRHALAALVTDDFVGDAVRRQLLDAPAVRLVAEIGQDDDVGNLADTAERLERAGHQGLAMHLAPEEIGQQRPDAFLGNPRAAVAMG
jgi:hypothetical protein